MTPCGWSTIENDDNPCPYLVTDDALKACAWHAKVADGLIDSYRIGITVRTIRAHRRSRGRTV